ncbi:MAG: class II fructose-bisphosphate aldolase [Bacilli bacterium]|jgi:fructose-bisphosphate aldolase class II|nr:class II fructose-bisphosphate aldolase [Bacilli bacterium]
MLANLKDVFKYAEEHKCAIGAFNTPNLENLKAVLDTVEKYNVPVIISHAQLHEPVANLDFIGPVMVLMAKKAKVPVVVHLDHGETVDYIHRALDIGFTSVMFDGSLTPYDENVANTRATVALAKKYGATVEAEVGIIGGRELPGDSAKMKPEDMYTKPELAKRFVNDTKIDALACAFGTVHGIYHTKPKLSFDTIKNVRAAVGIPLVMHGGSGVSPEDYIKAIAAGIEKINYYTYMSLEGVKAAKKIIAETPDLTFYHDIADAATKAMAADLDRTVRVFYGIK